MQNNKKSNKIRLQITFSSLIFGLVLLAFFYVSINYPSEYIVVAVTAVLLMICLYIVVNSIFSLRALKEERQEEQYDSIFKSEKASYLMLKKYFEQIDSKIDELKITSKIPTEEIINTQKGIAKVVINRNRENADAIMGSNDQLIDKMEAFEEKLQTNNGSLIESQKAVIAENIKELADRQHELLKSIKDMEIRLNQAIVSNPIQVTANVEVPQQQVAVPLQTVASASTEPQAISTQTVAPVSRESQEIPMTEEVLDDADIKASTVESVVTATAEEVAEAAVVSEAESVISEVAAAPKGEEVVAETTVAPEVGDETEAAITSEIEPIVTETTEEPIKVAVEEPAEILTAESVASETIASAEELVVFETAAPAVESVVSETATIPVEEPVVSETEAIPETETTASEVAAAESEAKTEPTTVEVATTEAIEESSPISAPTQESTPMPTPVDDNPNRQLTPEEIAAMFAGMSGAAADESETSTPNQPEPVPEESTPTQPEPVSETTAPTLPPASTNDDPNRQLSPDEIAALIANMQ